ncbi:oxidoreductase [Dehalobacter sp. DCM]|uniref:4Fe-4S dicluster domain-containing protein n=1 Tax=Dehalobacter sp. DCM TaxID=2907827 RepID=UPI00308203F7|nr:oxidoreductase [Dehalobacter sp. DCM]
MKKWHLIIDVEKCEDCNNCLMACKDEHVDNEWTGYSKPQPQLGQRWMNVMRAERGQYPLIDMAYRPTPCMHCDDAPCVKAGEGAVTKRPDGIVLIDPAKAKGKKELVNSCPYEVISWNEEAEVAQKCTLCAHLLDQGWKLPRCVQVCPTGALSVQYLEDADLERLVQKDELENLYPEYQTQPTVYYKNMYRFDRCFIAGSVAVNKHGIVDCLQGVSVKIYQDEKMIAETVTDAFGDFKVDKLLPQSGKYAIEVLPKGFTKKTIHIDLVDSVNVGEIIFSEN